MAPRVICVGDSVALRPAARVARCLGAAVEQQSGFDVAAIAERQPKIVLLHWTGALDVERVRALRAAHRTVRVVLLAAPSPPTDIKALFAEPWFDHLVGLESPWHMGDLTAVLARLLGQADFGLHAWLPWGARLIEHRIAGSATKDAVFDGIEAFMADIGVRGRLVHRMTQLADEMLMNAIYDAPIDRATGRARYAKQRRGNVVLEPDEQPVFTYGSDGQRFAMGIRDPFGALAPEVLRAYVHKGLRRGDDQIDRKEGGAGLGLFLLFQGLNTVCLNLQPGRLTEFIGLVNIRGSVREALTTPKSFHIFVDDGA